MNLVEQQGTSHPFATLRDSLVNQGSVMPQLGEDEILEYIELTDQAQPQISNISGQVDDQERAPSPKVAWQDPTLWSSCLPSAVPVFLDKVRKFLVDNIYSLLIICFTLPQNVMMMIIKLQNLECEDWGSFVEKFKTFQLIFFVLYPYFVKVKLHNN